MIGTAEEEMLNKKILLNPGEIFDVVHTDVPARRTNSSLPGDITFYIPSLNATADNFADAFNDENIDEELDFFKMKTTFVPLKDAKTKNTFTHACLDADVRWKLSSYSLSSEHSACVLIPLRLSIYTRYWIFNRSGLKMQFSSKKEICILRKG